MEFFRFLMNDVLSEPAVLVGLISLIGLIAQKKSVTECIKGTVKTILGFVILLYISVLSLVNARRQATAEPG